MFAICIILKCNGAGSISVEAFCSLPIKDARVRNVQPLCSSRSLHIDMILSTYTWGNMTIRFTVSTMHPRNSSFEMDVLKTFSNVWWTLGTLGAMPSPMSLNEPDPEDSPDKCHPGIPCSRIHGVSRGSLAPSSPEWIPGELMTDRREEPEIGIVFPSIWSEGTFDPSYELEAWNTRLLKPIWSEIPWSPETSTGTPDLPIKSVHSEPDDSGIKFMTGLMPPSFLVTRKMALTYWPGVGDTSIMAPLGPCPVLPCPPEHLFLDWKSVEKEAAFDIILTPILFGNIPSPHSRPKDLE